MIVASLGTPGGAGARRARPVRVLRWQGVSEGDVTGLVRGALPTRSRGRAKPRKEQS
ncbi:hypothetical protein GTS_22330 [Gandjariella thermophila]|uniref:Uncharacterized protein n=1 Tax=Gandjariella thermophila TaxID=1931992 RepID=A0A4D4J6A7_9PSEU|nr:hypothetical protein GTS_22330 [Gandjariella thermophila]